MKFPNLNFEISLIKSFWNSPSKIDWFRSLDGVATGSVTFYVVSIFLLIILTINEYDNKNKDRVFIAKLILIPLGAAGVYYFGKLFMYYTWWMGDFPWYVGILIVPLSFAFIIAIAGAILYRIIYQKKSRKKK
tara:strand:- start:308 stop:706 length:399 start_codon:yes stop_codon:yes gene_type:complete